MPELAKLVEIVQKPGGVASLSVDGVEFPWHVGPEMVVRYVYGQDELAGVELRLLADRVKVDDHRFDSNV